MIRTNRAVINLCIGKDRLKESSMRQCGYIFTWSVYVWFIAVNNMVSCNIMKPSFLSWLVLIVFVMVEVVISEHEEYHTYIIHMDHSLKPESYPTQESWHRSTLRSLSNPVDDDAMFLYSYNNVIHGFSARLTPSQLSEIEKSSAHIATHKESFAKLLTTHSTEFLRLSRDHGLWPTASYGEGVIIGIIDSGIWPESESFSDRGMSSVPERWKGKCENGTDFNVSLCNKKLIGARFFRKGMQAARNTTAAEYELSSPIEVVPYEYQPSSPRDAIGHGTHTSSTAAGNWVLGASHFGYARGTARGVAPRAHVAMYKVAWGLDEDEATISDILAGMDQAIADGVDVMSISLAVDQVPYFQDVMAIAALSAIEQGISVVCAAGNDFYRNSTYNGAPWITTIGAGTLDRSFIGTVTLGNDLTLQGATYFPENVYIRNTSFYYSSNDSHKAICDNHSLNTTEISGKVVICDYNGYAFSDQLEELHRAGAYAAIIISEQTTFLFPKDYTVPAIVVSKTAGSSIKEYATSMRNAKVKQMSFMLTRVGVKPAPQVAYFSSKGPDPVNPGILKPDIIAPGFDVLAAFIPKDFIDVAGRYGLVTDYALLSGTSMATPHVAGVTALLKAVHTDWSPAAIRSAMMTTAYNKGNDGTIIKNQLTYLNTSTPLDFGAGHIDPNKAVDPGLIYDLEFQDYVDFLCSLNYTKNQMKVVLRRNQWDCSEARYDLNYPSFVVIANSLPTIKSFTRVLTNVGGNSSVYNATFISSSDGLKVKVEPSILKFTNKYQKQNFSLHVEVDIDQARLPVYGFLKWIDQHNHIVSSPVVAISLGNFFNPST